MYLIFLSCKKESTESFGKSDALVEESETNAKSPEGIGKEIFEGRGNCVSCHQVDTKLIGPSLIEIAKIYSTDDSSAFVNGILDAVLHDISDTLTYKLKRSETKSATREE